MKGEKNYMPRSISFAEGFFGPRGDIGFIMYADYERAKHIIDTLILQGRSVCHAEMGLDGDWHENSSVIYRDGEYHEYDAHKYSQWAEPILLVFFNDGPSEKYSVWNKKEKI